MKMIGYIFFLLSVILTLLAACSTPTVSSDDSDVGSEKVEQEDRSSSSDMSNSKEADRSSSSEKNTESSSSEKTSESSSSSANEINCAALLEEHTGWSWNVPKVCRFNPDIEYGSMTDSRDGHVYRTVKIGEQIWMAENLNYADSAKTRSLKGRSWCYNNMPKNCDVAGRLYSWAASIDSLKLATNSNNPLDCGYRKTCTLPEKVQGICPDGWHLPTYSEWVSLFTAVGGQSTASAKLKSQSGWYSIGSGDDAFGGGGDDSFGFSALPAGEYYYSGNFSYGAYHALFWSSTEVGDGYAIGMELDYANDGASLYNDCIKVDGFSVRCIKN